MMIGHAKPFKSISTLVLLLLGGAGLTTTALIWRKEQRQKTSQDRQTRLVCR